MYSLRFSRISVLRSLIALPSIRLSFSDRLSTVVPVVTLMPLNVSSSSASILFLVSVKSLNAVSIVLCVVKKRGSRCQK